MIIGITKILILFPVLPYLIFLITSKNRKMAHVYCGPLVALANFFILNYLFNIIFVLIVFAMYVFAIIYFAKEKIKKKRTPKRFWMNVLYYMSWLGFRLYVTLVVLGTIIEMMN